MVYPTAYTHTLHTSILIDISKESLADLAVSWNVPLFSVLYLLIDLSDVMGLFYDIGNAKNEDNDEDKKAVNILTLRKKGKI